MNIENYDGQGKTYQQEVEGSMGATVIALGAITVGWVVLAAAAVVVFVG